MKQFIFRTPKDKDNSFTQISNKIIKSKKLKDREFRILSYMLSMPDNHKFTYEKLAIKLDRSLSTIKRSIAELKKLGYIETITTIEKTPAGNYYTDDFEIFVYESPAEFLPELVEVSDLTLQIL